VEQKEPDMGSTPGESENLKVLLVDDEVEFVETLAERLRTRGFHVEVATSGTQAVEMARADAFSAAVIDFAMPVMDGIQTIRALREVDPRIPFILLSGEATIKAGVEAARLGAVDVLEKPVDIGTVVEKLEEARG
jgi:DNA-binding NtrC family response regulator